MLPFSFARRRRRAGAGLVQCNQHKLFLGFSDPSPGGDSKEQHPVIRFIERRESEEQCGILAAADNFPICT
jgi:hypothetical protein